MDRVGLPLTSADADLLVKAFRVPAADRTDINYKWCVACAACARRGCAQGWGWVAVAGCCLRRCDVNVAPNSRLPPLLALPQPSRFIEALDNPDTVLERLPGAGEDPAVAGAVVGEYHAPPADRTQKLIPRSNIALDDLLERIQSEFGTRRIRMREFMRDYDRLNHGKMPAAKLRTALAAAGVPLRPEELDLLEEAYRVDDGEVQWRELAYIVDGGNEYLEQEPTKTLSPVKRRDMMATAKLTDSAVLNLLDSLRRFVAFRNMLVKPFFQDYDPHRNRCVTRHQFAAVLNLLKLPVSEADVEALQNSFAATGLGQEDKVNYLDFCRRIDPTER